MILRRHWLPLVALLLVAVAALPILTYPMGRDQGMYANIARGILNGQLPYIDVWDIKPPAIYYIYALGIAIFGPSAAALRAIDLVTALPTALALYWLGHRLAGKRVAILTIVIFPVFYFTETFASLTQSDSIVTLPMILAVAAAFKTRDYPPDDRRALIGAFLTGALCALTLWFKHYYVVFVLVLVADQLLARRRLPFKEVVLFCMGGLLVGLGGAAYFLTTGILQEMLQVAQSTSQYTALGYDPGAFFTSMLNYAAFRWQHWGVLIALVLLWPLARRRQPADTRLPGWRLVILWLLSGLGFVLLQAKGFDTHWLPMLPPMALLGAYSTGVLLDSLAGRLSHRFTPQAGYASIHLVAILAFLFILVRVTWLRAWPYLTGREDQIAYYERFQANDLKPAESLTMVEFLRKRVAPGDTLFVWGFRPEVYYLAELRPATRFIAHFPLVSPWYPAQWRQEAVETLWAAMPPYVLVLEADYMPWVTGRSEDSHELLVEYTGLSDWLAFNYERETQIGDFLVWRRKS